MNVPSPPSVGSYQRAIVRIDVVRIWNDALIPVLRLQTEPPPIDRDVMLTRSITAFNPAMPQAFTKSMTKGASNTWMTWADEALRDKKSGKKSACAGRCRALMHARI
jgi:hypothetical protein